MSKTLLRAATVLAATAGFALASAGSANATPMQLFISVTVGATTLTEIFSDVTLGSDTVTPQSSPNNIDIPTTTINGLTVSTEIGQQTSSPFLELVSTATTITNNNSTPASIVAVLSGMNFAGPAGTTQYSASGNWTGSGGSVVTANYYNDPANVLGGANGTDTPGNKIGTFVSPPAGAPLGSYNFTSSVFPLPAPDTGAFSMTEEWSYTLAASGSLDSRSQTEIAFAAPEPASLLLLGASLTGLGFVSRRRKSSSL